MNAAGRLLRWLGIAVALGLGIKSTGTRHGRIRGLLPVLMLGTTTLETEAQPRILTHPRNAVVLMGSNVTFRVNATDVGTLAYQWRLEGRELPDAVGSSLVVSNVSLADFGRYTVTVRSLNGQTDAKPAWLKLARWTEMVVFDASISFKDASNGNSWVEWFGELIGLTAPNQIKNYATGGATGSDVRSQILRYLAAGKPGPNTLLAPWWSGMSSDLAWNNRTVDFAVSNYATNLALLAEGGGKMFILPTLVPLYLNPGLSNSYSRSLDYNYINARMDSAIAKLQAVYDLTVFRFDFARLAIRAVTHPTDYGFTNVVNAANACTSCDPSKFLWWDGAHPTTKFHHMISEETYRCLTPPMVLEPPTRGANGGVKLAWKGGSPPFLLQHSRDLAANSWQSVEPTFETSSQVDAAGSPRFFRVLQLGQ